MISNEVAELVEVAQDQQYPFDVCCNSAIYPMNHLQFL